MDASPSQSPITDRLAPLLASGPQVEPLPVPEVGLREATLMHPTTTEQDLVEVQSLQPLPPELDAALGRIVAAHGVAATHLEAVQDPGPATSLTAMATLGWALDESWPVLQAYKKAPIDPAAASADASEDASQPPASAPPLDDALLDLYGAMGLDTEVVDALEDNAVASKASLPEDVREPVAALVHALADYHRAALDVARMLQSPPDDLVVSVPTSHSLDGMMDAIEELEDTVEETPLQDLQEATQRVVSTVDEARSALNETPAGQLTHSVWSGPLGLVVVGTPGCDVFDADPRRVPCNGTRSANRTDAGGGGSDSGTERSVSAPNVGTPVAPTVEPNASASAAADATGLSEPPEPGWHMLVLDPGGNDTYHSNAGGVDAGSVQVQVNVTAGGVVENARTVFVDSNSEGDDLCVPTVTFCLVREPIVGSLQTIAPNPGTTVRTSRISTGLGLGALVLDRGGDDTYNGTGFDVSQGSARGLGLGVLVEETGDDAYRADTMAQGASEMLGTGFLADLTGDDTYKARSRAQGYADVPSPGARLDGTGLVGQTACQAIEIAGISQGSVLTDYKNDDGNPRDDFRVPDCVDALALFGVRHARGTLVDTAGNDTYSLDDLLAGHGTTRMHDDLVRMYLWIRAVHPDFAPGVFVDVLGAESLPSPEAGGGPVRPSTYSTGDDGPVSGQHWLHRILERDGSLALWKTAVNVQGEPRKAHLVCQAEDEGPATPAGTPLDLLRQREDQCRLSPERQRTIDTDGSGSGGSPGARPCPMWSGQPWDPREACPPDPFGPDGYRPQTPDLVPTQSQRERTYPVEILFADAVCLATVPLAVIATPICTYWGLTHEGGGSGGAETEARGRQASTESDEPEDSERNSSGDQGTLLIGSPTEVESPPPLTIVLPTRGREDTIYEGEIVTPAPRNTASGPALATSRTNLLVDLGGRDAYLAGNASNPRGDAALASATTGGTSSETVGLLVDQGGARMRSGNETVAHSQGGAIAVLGMDGGLDIESGERSQGYAKNASGLALLHLGDGSAGPSRLSAGNASQAVANLGTAVLAGSPTDDSYRVDGWGMGLCASRGGQAVFLEQRGDDSYDLGSEVGLGDCTTLDDQSLSESDLGGALLGGATEALPSTETSSGAPEGAGVFMDVRGDDTYRLDRWPSRPEGVERFGWPGQDRAWASGVPSDSEAGDHRQDLVVDSDAYQSDSNVLVRSDVSAANAVTAVGVDDVRSIPRTLGLLCRLDPGSPCDASADADGSADVAVPEDDPTGQIDQVDSDDVASEVDRPASARAGERNGSLFVNASAQDGVGSVVDIARSTLLPSVPLAGQPLSRDLTIEAGRPSDDGGDSGSLMGGGGPCEGERPLPQRGVLQAADDREPVTCLSPDSDLLGLQWGQQGISPVLTPIEQAACNCSVRVEITPMEGDAVFMNKRGLLPRAGRLTTAVTKADPWVQKWNRLGGPGAQAGEAQRISDVVEGSGDVLVDLADLPATATSVRVEMEVWDNAAEETGGLVPPARGSWQGPLVQPARVADASAVEHEDRWWLLLEAKGPLPQDTIVFLEPPEESEDTRLPASWKPVRLEDATNPWKVVDLASPDLLGSTAPVHGERACAAALLPDLSGQGGFCWTGKRLVTAVPLETDEPPEQVLVQETRGAEDRRLTVDRSVLSPGEASVRVQGAPDQSYSVGGLENETRGVPGSDGLEEGQTWVRRFLEIPEDRPVDRWVNVTVEAAGPGAVAASVQPTVTLYNGSLRAFQPQLDGAGEEVEEENASLRRTWRPVAHEGALVNTTRHEIQCIWSHSYNPDILRRIVHRVNEADEPACVAEVVDRNVTLSLRIGDAIPDKHHGTSVIAVIEASALDAEGRLHHLDESGQNRRLALHIDTQATPGQAIVSPTESTSPTTNVTVSPGATSSPGLLGDERTDLVAAHVEGRALGEDEWTRLSTFDADAIHKDRPRPRAVDLSSLVGNETQRRLEVRTVFVDESGNHFTPDPPQFLYDAKPPAVTNASVVVENGETFIELETDEPPARLACGLDCQVKPTWNPLDDPIRPRLHPGEAETGFGGVKIPVSDLVLGIPYEVTVSLVDRLGNQGLTNATFETAERLVVDGSPVRDNVLNRTATLTWRSALAADATRSAAQISTSAWLEVPNATCPLLDEYPALETGSPESPTLRTVGPLTVDCPVEEGQRATLLLAAHAPRRGWFAHDRTPVQVDDRAPRVTVDAPSGWLDASAHLSVATDDALPVDLTATLNGEVVDLREDASSGTRQLTVSEAGVHELALSAVDDAGNQAKKDVAIKIDRDPPRLTAEWAGRSDHLGLVEIRIDDALSGADQVRATVGNASAPWLDAPGEDTALVGVPLNATDEPVIVQGRDRAGNVARQALHVDPNGSRVNRTTPQLSAAGPATIELGFSTDEPARPVVVVESEAGDRVRRVLDRGTEHTASLGGLSPGSRVNVTTSLAEDGELVPLGRNSITLPPDDTPPDRLTEVRTERTDEGVLLSWEPPADDVGVESVVVQRGGEELARVESTNYRDPDPPDRSVAYTLTPVDLAGNAGPSTSIDAAPARDVRVVDVAFEPANPSPGTPTSLSVELATSAGTLPDLVVLDTWDGPVALERVTPPGEHVTYAAKFPAPELTLGVEDPEFSLTVRSGDRTVVESVEPPIVAQLQTDQTGDRDVPALPLAGLLAVLLGAALCAGRRSQ